jgi:tRNA-dihydrouridine synthase B
LSLLSPFTTFAPMKIGNVEFGPYPVFLAPMEDVTDIGFRLLCKRFGAAMVYSEFVAADALVRMVNRSLEKLAVCDDERPVAIQIYGKEPGPVADAARIVVERARPDVLDLNFGCPVKRVAGKGAGAGMLQNIPKMLEITQAVVDAVDIPVTVKTRLGWDESSKVIVDLAERLQDCGIRALTIHGRTRAQMYTGEADWTLIGEVKNNPRMTIPIIGNGDITSPERARECFDRYGVDAVMVGRATFGRPWIFKEITDVLNPGSASAAHEAVKSGYPVMSADWKIDVLKEQVLTSVRRIDEYRGILHSRRHLAASPVFKGIPNFRETRIAMLRAETVDELFAILERAREAVRRVSPCDAGL